MTELARSFAAGALWLLAFLVIALHTSRALRRGSEGDADDVGLIGGTGLTRSGVLLGYPLFAAYQVALTKGLAAVGLLGSAAVLAAFVVTVAAGVAVWARGRGGPIASRDRLESASATDDDLIRRVVLVGGATIVCGLAVMSLVVPLTIWDVLAYHMPMVASYIQNASFDPWPTQDLRQIFRVNAGEVQLLNVALLSRSDAWVELPSVLGIVVCLVATFELAWLAFRRRPLAWLVVALVLTAPQMLFGAASAKNDLIFTAALLGAFVWAVKAGSSPPRATAYASFAGLCGAITAATKVMGLPVLGAAGLWLLILLVRGRLPFRAVIAFGVTAVLTLVVLVGDVYWANFARAAMPVGLAPNEVHYRFGVGNLVAAAHFYVYDLTLKRLLIAQVFEHDFAHYGYFFPFLALGGVIAALRQVVMRGARTVASAGLTVMAAALFLAVIAVRFPIEWDQRFMIWLVPTLAVLAVTLVARFDGRRLLSLATAAISVAIVNLFLIFSNGAEGVFARSAAYLATTGTLARDVDVPSPKYAGMIEGFSVLDRATATDSVLYIGSDDWWMYPAWGRGFARHVRGVWNAEDAVQQLAARRQRFVVIESAAKASIRDAATEAARRSGYVPAFSSDRRVILERAPPPSTSMAR